MLIHPDYRIWDFWTIFDGGQHHLYFLKAPRTGPANMRHDLAHVGHATSMDLVNWEWHENALYPGSPGTWDDLSIWTGSVIGFRNKWFMFYTGRDKITRTQNIGLATSDNLERFTRNSLSPAFQPDPKWYRTSTEEAPEVFTWRDPYVVYESRSNLHYLFLSAHDRSQPDGYQGAIGLAVSQDLYHWTVHPPVLSPGWFQDMEVPTVIWWNDSWHLFVSVKSEWYHPSSPFRERTTGTLCFRSDKITGPFEYVGHPLRGDDWYASRPVRHENQWYVLGWRMGEEEGYPHHALPYTIDNPRVLGQGSDHKVYVSTP